MDKNHRFSDIESAMREQVVVLRSAVASELKMQRLLRREIKSIESQINDFLSDYLKRIDPIAHEIKQLKQAIDEYCMMLNVNKPDEVVVEKNQSTSICIIEDTVDELEQAHEIQSIDLSNKERFVDEEAKQIYRKLVKHFHPDVSSEENENDEAFELLQKSYEKNDLDILILLEQSVESKQSGEQEYLAQKLERLEKQLDALKCANDRDRWQKYELEHSESYQLLQRITWSKMCGDNMLSEIEISLNKEVEELREEYFSLEAELLNRDSNFSHLLEQRYIVASESTN